jgi:hypothetical protein
MNANDWRNIENHTDGVSSMNVVETIFRAG